MKLAPIEKWKGRRVPVCKLFKMDNSKERLRVCWKEMGEGEELTSSELS